MSTSVVKPADFKTKKALTEYTKNTINSIGVCQSLRETNIIFFNFLCELFKRHPDYSNKIINMNDIFIVRNTMNPSCYELQLRREDGSCEDISWRICISGKRKDSIKAAMRAAVSDQIIAFKNRSRFCCELCGTCEGTSHNFHVDHVVQFSSLLTAFISMHPNRPTEFGSNAYNIACFLPEDAGYERLWQEYHRSNASLRILCANCNLTRPRIDSDSD